MELREYEVTDRNRVNRVPKRAHYDEATVHAILDHATVCQIGIVEDGQPIVIPMFFVRMGDEILVHGANKGRLGRHLESGAPVSVTVTMVDGLVLARSAFHHSLNYRSVVAFGTGRRIVSEDEIAAAVRAITEKVMPGRADDCRPPNAKELKATTFLAIRMETASAKIRAAGVLDEEEDLSLPFWAGVVPLHQAAATPQPDSALAPGTTLPAYIEAFLRSNRSTRATEDGVERVPESFLAQPGRAGRFGAILDETDRAARELCAVVERIAPARYLEVRVSDIPDTTSIRNICRHTVNWAYAYSNYIRTARRLEADWSQQLGEGALEDARELRVAFAGAFRHTEESLAGFWDASAGEAFEHSFQVPWGPTFDPETILERGLAHVLRHRRQIERW